MKKIINTILRGTSILFLLSSPFVYYLSNDKFLSILIITVSLFIFVFENKYVIKSIQISELKLELQEKIKEINITKDQFDETIGKLIENEYYNLSRKGYSDMDRDGKEILPILDDLRNNTGNVFNPSIKINRNNAIYNILASYVSNIRWILKRSKNNIDYVSVIDELGKLNITNISSITPDNLRNILNSVLVIDEIDEIFKDFDAMHKRLEL